MEFLEANIDWLTDRIEKQNSANGCKYFIFDLPGQVEIYSNHNSLKSIIKKLSTKLHFSFSALHLVDVKIGRAHV